MKKHTLKLLKELDFKLILTIVLIFTFGIVILSSATHVNKTGNYKHIIKQLLAFSMGILWVSDLGNIQEGVIR